MNEKTDYGKLKKAAGAALGLIALLLVIRTATPSSVNIYVNGDKKRRKKH